MSMADTGSFYDNWTPRLLSVLRIMAGFLFMAHGAQKLFGFLAPPGAPTPPLMSQIGIAGVLEFVGGILLLIGLFTRPTAFILSGLMAVAYFQAHAPQGFWPLQNRGELAVLYCFVFLFLAVAGGGVWSVDRCIGRRPAGRF
ncbi:MAG TPA: DoxX family protein [Pyrinomonadaceae bacterium]|nr:DoxX family protein [Pyrinomonadaceae bacterium]